LASLAPLVELLPRVAQTTDLALPLGDLPLRGDASDLNLIVCALRAHQADLELPGLLGCGKLVFDLPNVAGELFPPRLDPPGGGLLRHASSSRRFLLQADLLLRELSQLSDPLPGELRLEEPRAVHERRAVLRALPGPARLLLVDASLLRCRLRHGPAEGLQPHELPLRFRGLPRIVGQVFLLPLESLDGCDGRVGLAAESLDLLGETTDRGLPRTHLAYLDIAPPTPVLGDLLLKAKDLELPVRDLLLDLVRLLLLLHALGDDLIDLLHREALFLTPA